MTAPVPVYRARVIFGTRRVRRGFFRLAPAQVREAIKYIAIHYALRHNIELWAFIVLGNHIHWIGFDRDGRYPDFIRDMHMRIQEVVNDYHGLQGRLWAAERPRTLRCVGTALSRLLYVVTNAVKHRIVDVSTNWPGLLFSPEDAGKRITARCPGRLQELYNTFPETVTYTVPIPNIAAGATTRVARREFARLRRGREATLISRRDGKSALGVRAALEVGPWDRPATEPERTPFRCFACAPKSEKACRNELDAWRRHYALARRNFRQGRRDTKWPAGTYAMHHWHCCPRSREGP